MFKSCGVRVIDKDGNNMDGMSTVTFLKNKCLKQ